MKSFTVAVLAALVSLVGCTKSTDPVDALDETQEEDVVSVDQALTPPGGDQCATVSPAALDAVLALVESAQDRGAAALAAHPNETHTYLAEYLLVNLNGVHTTLSSNQTWLQGPASDNQPGTNYVEGLSVYSAIWSARANLEEARWYAILSSVYLSEDDAYFAFEDLSLATEVANDLATRGARCFMNAYGLPSSH